MTQQVDTSRRMPLWARAALTILALVTGVILAVSAWVFVQLRASLPRLEGSVAAPALSAPVTVARDAQGGQYRNFRVWVGRLILSRPWLV